MDSSNDKPYIVQVSHIQPDSSISFKADWLSHFGFPPLSFVLIRAEFNRVVIRSFDPSKIQFFGQSAIPGVKKQEKGLRPKISYTYEMPDKKYLKSPKFKNLLDTLDLGEFYDYAQSYQYVADHANINVSRISERFKANPDWAKATILGAIAKNHGLTKTELDAIIALRKVKSGELE